MNRIPRGVFSLVLLVAIAFLVLAVVGRMRRSAAPPESPTTAVDQPEPPPRSSRRAVPFRQAVRSVQRNADAGDRALSLPGADRPDAIRDEYILSFFSAKDRDAFIRQARRWGADVLDSMPLGFSLRIRAGRDVLARLRDEAPMAVEFDANYRVRTPPLPLLDPRQADANTVGFGDRVLEWLGVQGNGEWGTGIKVAILDTGVNPHPVLENVSVTRVDLLGGSGLDSSTDSAHGTAVASVIAGRSDGVRGIAPQVDLLSIRVVAEGQGGDTFTAAKGIVEAVDRGASVINCSFGSRSDSFLLRAAVEYAASHGAVVVASTGNEAVRGISFPAAYADCVAVAAVDGRGEHLYFSNRGTEVDLAAPGLGIPAAWTSKSVVPFSGTSASAPLVSGAIAAVMSQTPGLTAGQAVTILKKYSTDAAAPGVDPELGSGIVNMRRVEERNQSGIHDARVGRPFLTVAGEGGDVRVAVYAQNTGTEPLGSLLLTARINGARHSLRFNNVQVGQTVSHEVVVSGEEAALRGKLTIETAAELDGVDDVFPADNTRTMTMVPGP